MGQPIHIAGHVLADQQALLFTDQHFIGSLKAGEAPIKLGKLPLVSAVAKQAIHIVGKVVTGRAANRPVPR